MNNKELNELENPDQWDWDKAEKKTGRRGRRTVVSVGFVHTDFEKVSQFAEKLGLNVSTLVRVATLGKIAEVEASNGPLTLSEPRTGVMPLAPSTAYRIDTTTGIEIDSGRTEVLSSRILIPS